MPVCRSISRGLRWTVRCVFLTTDQLAYDLGVFGGRADFGRPLPGFLAVVPSKSIFFKWQNQESYRLLIQQTNKICKHFYKIRTKVPQNVVRIIYFAFVHSHLLYGLRIEVYANTTANHLSKLIVLNNKLLRILQYKSMKSHSIDHYKTYSTLPIQLLHNYQILIFIHKYFHNSYSYSYRVSLLNNCSQRNHAVL